MSEEKEQVKEFVVDVDKWRSGGSSSNRTGEGATVLHNQHGYKCCLGFVCKDLGVSDSEMRGVGRPENIISPNRGKVIDAISSSFISRAIDINDDNCLSLKERVEKLRKLFKKHGFKIRFKNLKKHLK